MEDVLKRAVEKALEEHDEALEKNDIAKFVLLRFLADAKPAI